MKVPAWAIVLMPAHLRANNHKGGKFALQKDFAVISGQTHDVSEDS